jgi:hypothetical protein
MDLALYSGRPSVINLYQISNSNNLVFILPSLVINLILGVGAIVKIHFAIRNKKSKKSKTSFVI